MQMALHDMQQDPQAGDSGTTASPWDIPRRPGEGKPPREPDFRQRTWLCTWLRRRSGRLCGYTPILGLRPVVWLDGHGLGRTVTGKVVTKKFGKEEYG